MRWSTSPRSPVRVHHPVAITTCPTSPFPASLGQLLPDRCAKGSLQKLCGKSGLLVWKWALSHVVLGILSPSIPSQGQLKALLHDLLSHIDPGPAQESAAFRPRHYELRNCKRLPRRCYRKDDSIRRFPSTRIWICKSPPLTASTNSERLKPTSVFAQPPGDPLAPSTLQTPGNFQVKGS